MSKSPFDSVDKNLTEVSDALTEDDLVELRKILFEPEQKRLKELQNRLDNPKLHASDVSQVLAESIILRAARDNDLARALEPTIAEAIRTSIKKDRKFFAEILLPVIGPAIRRAIASVLRSMVESINHILENSFSIRSLLWRLEALRTRKPFGEIVLINTLVYQVEQVFLIHKNTGLTLQHVIAKESITQDPDLVSSMLTAIQDFIKDSFVADENEGIDILHIGDRSLWIEQGSHAILAAVIRGNPPESLRTALSETIESIHIDHSEKLEVFDGNIGEFESTRSQLEACIDSQFKKKKRFPTTSWVVFGLVLLGIVTGISFLARDHYRWINYLESLNRTPGVIVTASDRRIGRADRISGLRDPLAADPLEMLKTAKIKPDKVEFLWETYYSLHPDISLKRTNINQYQYDNYANAAQNLSLISKRIDEKCLYFNVGESEILLEHDASLQELVSNINEIQRLAKTLGTEVYIEITGHTDRIGLLEDNLKLSKERADSVLYSLVSKGLSKDIFTSRGVGTDRLLKAKSGEIIEDSNRCVTFRVFFHYP